MFAQQLPIHPDRVARAPQLLVTLAGLQEGRRLPLAKAMQCLHPMVGLGGQRVLFLMHVGFPDHPLGHRRRLALGSGSGVKHLLVGSPRGHKTALGGLGSANQIVKLVGLSEVCEPRLCRLGDFKRLPPTIQMSQRLGQTQMGHRHPRIGLIRRPWQDL